MLNDRITSVNVIIFCENIVKLLCWLKEILKHIFLRSALHIECRNENVISKNRLFGSQEHPYFLKLKYEARFIFR